MTVPKWLIPVLAAVAALAVGAAAALFAVRFAAPETTRIETTTIEAPVLAPVSDDLTLEELVAESGDEVPVSPTIAIGEAVDPDSVPDDAVPEDLAELIDDLATADDPADVLPPAVVPAPDTPAGDPCATEDAAADCPEGAPGTILTLDGDLPPLTVWSTGANDSECAAPDEPGTVRFWARTNVPVTFNLRISQGDPRRQVVETTDEAIERWTEESLEGEAWVQHCIEIVDLIPDVSVVVYLDATDELDRRATRALTLAVSDGLGIPPTRIHPIGDSTVFVSAPHVANETTRIRVIPGDRGTEPSCTYDGSGRALPTVPHSARTETVSGEYLAAHDYEPAYTRRSSATFAVTPSTPLIVCIGWFPASDGRPTFERDTPLRVSEYRMTSPDVVAPVVRVAEVVLTSEAADDSVLVRGTTENGQRCGAWRGPQFSPGEPNVVCDYGALIGWTDAGGALLVTTEVQTPEGLAVNDVLLDVGLLSCVSGCSGRTRSYDVPLSTFIRPHRICSDDCRVNVGETIGFLRLRATWPASTAGTGEGWVLGTWREGAPVATRDAQPELDTSATFTVSPSASGVPRAFQASATVRVDRAVTASAELLWAESVPGICPRPGGSHSWTSEGPGSTHRIAFDGLCAGVTYNVRLTLTADDGATSTYLYAAPTADTRLWVGGSFVTPAERLPVVVGDVRISTGEPDRVLVLRAIRVEVGGVDARVLRGHSDQNCFVGDVHGIRSGLSAAPVGEVVLLRVTATLGAGTVVPGTTTPDFPTYCVSEGTSYGDTERLEFTGWVSYDEFLAGPTITMTDAATGYTATVVLTDSL
jgi:hypothetical protein